MTKEMRSAKRDINRLDSVVRYETVCFLDGLQKFKKEPMMMLAKKSSMQVWIYICIYLCVCMYINIS